MHDNRSHPLLEQVPLTVSPFVQLPRATTLPYRYKTMPSTLPLSIIEGQDASGSNGKTPYVQSPANSLAAHPDDILASCQALLAHLDRMQADAKAELAALTERIQERELAEKRRVAPGWLDSEARLLIPERKDTPGSNKSTETDEGRPFQLSEMAAALPESAASEAADSSLSGFSADALTQAFGSTAK